MSPRPVSVSRVLDLLQSWGAQPVVNPVKLVDGRLPEVPPHPWDEPRLALPLLVLTILMLTAIFLAWLLAPSGGTSFIYENF